MSALRWLVRKLSGGVRGTERFYATEMRAADLNGEDDLPKVLRSSRCGQ